MDYIIHIINSVLIYITLVASLNLILGYAGIVSMCHAALFGIGGYVSALLAMHLGLNFLIGILLAMATTGIIGLLLAIPSLRIKDEYLILFTCAFQLVVYGLMVTEIDITRGETGLSAIPRANLFGLQFVTPRSYLPLLLVLCAILFLICWRVSHSPFGRMLKCIRENESATESLGKNVLQQKVLTFMVGGMVAGAAGSIFAHYNAYLNPVSFSLHSTILMIAMVILGGSANMLGSVVGALLLLGIPEALRFIPGTATLIGPLRDVVYGGLLILFMRFLPQGLIPEHAGMRPPQDLDVDKSFSGTGSIAHAQRETVPNGEARSVLEVRGIRKNFGGIQAVKSFAMDLLPGKITALVGPNGCGKTTVFNIISGFIRPDEGVVSMKGREITKTTPHELVRRGLVRSWQDVRIFENMSMLDNVMVACPNQGGENLLKLFFAPASVAAEEKVNFKKAMTCLNFVGLAHKAHQLAGQVSYAEQKLLSLARLLATECSIFLLDEPASGVDLTSVEQMKKVIQNLADAGKTICLVEHNLDVVRDLAHQAYFMDQGDVLRKGTPSELMADAKLSEIYFGS